MKDTTVIEGASFSTIKAARGGAISFIDKRRILVTKIGDRVGAINFIDKGTAHLFGFGVYEGDLPLAFDSSDGEKVSILNPLIRLDNGKTVRGHECWWGPEEQVRKVIEKMEVVYVETASS